MATITSGNTASPTRAITRSAKSICTIAISIIAIVPTAIGSGAMGDQAASTSELAFESSCPVGWRWCHSIGRERYCRVTSRRYAACIRYCITPAPSRRATMPTARRIETPTKKATTATSTPGPMVPSRNAGTIAWSVAHPSTQASATVSAPKSTLPSVDRVKIHFSRRIATPSTRNPSRNVEVRVEERESAVVTGG